MPFGILTVSLTRSIAEHWASLRNTGRLLRLTPFDTSSERGRYDERHRRALINAAASVVAKVASVGANLVVIPLLLSFLGEQRFGVWVTITSFVMLLSFTDLGIGNGLMTAVSQASGRADPAELRRLVTAGLMATTAIGVLLASLIAVLYPFVPWAHLLNVDGEAAAEVGPAIAVLGVSLGLAMPANVATRVEIGMQRGFVSSVLQIVGAALSLAFTYTAVQASASLPWLVGAAVGAPVCAALANSVLFFSWRRPDLRPGWLFLSRPVLVSLLRMGLLFFALQLALALGMWSDNIIVSRLLGPQAVTQYAIPARLYGLISIAIILATGPLWPAYGEAMARGDRDWARRTLARTMRLAGVGALCASIVLSFLLQPILNLWIGGEVQVSGLLMASLALAAIVESWRASVVMFLNGSAIVGLQIGVDLSFALVCIAIRVALVSAIGLPGIPLGAVLAFCVTTLGPYAWYLQKRFRTDLARA